MMSSQESCVCILIGIAWTLFCERLYSFIIFLYVFIFFSFSCPLQLVFLGRDVFFFFFFLNAVVAALMRG